MKITELVITFLYMVSCIGAGLYFRKRALNSPGDYWAARGQISTGVNTFAIFAALASGATMLGNVGLAYKLGWAFAFPAVLGTTGGLIFASVFVAKQLRNLGKYTITDFLNFRYNNRAINFLVPLAIVGTYIAYLVGQLKAAGIVGQFLLNFDYLTSMIIVAFVFTLYTSIGGMWAVTWTDFFQGLLMILIATFSAVVVILHFGGVGTVIAEGVRVFPGFGKSVLPISSIAGFLLIPLTAWVIMPHTIMKAYSARDPFSARMAFNLSTILWGLVCVFLYVIVAAAARVFQPNIQNADMAYLVVVGKLFGPLMTGVTIAAIFAAIMSTTSGQLLACAASLSNDLYIRFFNKNASEAVQVRIGFASIWMLGFIAVILALNPPALLTILQQMALGFFASAVFVPIILGMWWKRATSEGALAGIVIGGLTYLGLVFFTKMPLMSHILVSLPLSFAVVTVVSLLTRPPSVEILQGVEKLHADAS